LLALFGYLYFVPYFVARHRHHPQILAIGVINLFAGWTLIGWVGALAWACTTIPPQAVTPPLPSLSQSPSPLVFPRQPTRPRA
jgi:hypothetical protein